MPLIIFVIVGVGPELHAGLEVREIEAALKDQAVVIAPQALNAGEIVGRIRDAEPDVIHLIGHGASSGSGPSLIVRGAGSGHQSLELKDLCEYLTAMVESGDLPKMKCVFVNTCMPRGAAEMLLACSECVVSGDGWIENETARYFAGKFYESVAKGLDVGRAFADARHSTKLNGLVATFTLSGSSVLTEDTNDEVAARSDRLQMGGNTLPVRRWVTGALLVSALCGAGNALSVASSERAIVVEKEGVSMRLLIKEQDTWRVAEEGASLPSGTNFKIEVTLAKAACVRLFSRSSSGVELIYPGRISPHCLSPGVHELPLSDTNRTRALELDDNIGLEEIILFVAAHDFKAGDEEFIELVKQLPTEGDSFESNVAVLQPDDVIDSGLQGKGVLGRGVNVVETDSEGSSAVLKLSFNHIAR